PSAAFLLNKVNGYRVARARASRVSSFLVTDGASNSKGRPDQGGRERSKPWAAESSPSELAMTSRKRQLDKHCNGAARHPQLQETSTFSELVEPQFVDDIISEPPARVGKVNKGFDEGRNITNKRSGICCRETVEINWEEMGFKKVDRKSMLMISLLQKPRTWLSSSSPSGLHTFPLLATLRSRRANSERREETALPGAADSPYTPSAQAVRVPKLLVSGLVRSSKIEKLKSAGGRGGIEAEASLEVVRQASRASCGHCAAWSARPPTPCRASAARTRRKLADKEAVKLKKATSQSRQHDDKLIVASNKARAKRDQEARREVSDKEHLETASGWPRSMGRIAQAQKEIKLSDDKISKAPKAKKKGEKGDKEKKEKKGKKGKKEKKREEKKEERPRKRRKAKREEREEEKKERKRRKKRRRKRRKKERKEEEKEERKKRKKREEREERERDQVESTRPPSRRRPEEKRFPSEAVEARGSPGGQELWRLGDLQVETRAVRGSRISRWTRAVELRESLQVDKAVRLGDLRWNKSCEARDLQGGQGCGGSGSPGGQELGGSGKSQVDKSCGGSGGSPVDKSKRLVRAGGSASKSLGDRDLRQGVVIDLQADRAVTLGISSSKDM
uniref:PHD-type domain-containing protein n=1 Tax=Macrostomum lignano TaxID=282301 RepID=A0A1I8FCP3_9PLAT